MMNPETIAVSILVLTYLLILSEMVHKTVAALLGALLMVVYGVVEYGTIGSLIEFKTLTVVLGIFIIINVIELSGLFEYLAVKVLKLTKGNPLKLMFAITALGFFISTMFTEIPTALILGTLIIKISKRIKISPIPYLIIISMVVDIGGLLTPVSSLQNIMISSAVGIKFTEFTGFMLPLYITLLIAGFFYFRFVFRKELNAEISKEDLKAILELDENKEVKSWKLFKRSLVIMSFIMLFFFLQDITGIGNEAVAMTGAILLLLLSSASPDEVFAKVEWSALAFFIGLFIVIGGVEKVGALEHMANFAASYMEGPLSASIITIGFSTIASSFLDNIPVIALLIPIAKQLTMMFGLATPILFYAIAIGTNVGGNITPIGSPSNVVILSMAEKEKHPINIGYFIKIGFMYTMINITISVIYLIIRSALF